MKETPKVKEAAGKCRGLPEISHHAINTRQALTAYFMTLDIER